MTTNRKPSSKGGGLTRAQQTRSLRKRAGFSTKRLVPKGVPITFDETAGLMNLAEILHAEAQQRGGRSKQLSDWTRLKTTPAFLEAVGLSTGIPVDSLIDRSHGKEPWGHPLVAVEIARWLSPVLGVLINAWWLETVNGHVPVMPKLPPEHTVLRRLANKALSEVCKELELPFNLVHRMKVHYLTGHPPDYWAKRFGKDWLDRCSLDHQQLQHDAAVAASVALQQAALPPPGAEGRKTQGFYAMRGQIQKVREYGLLLGRVVVPDAAQLLEAGA
jgi:hypothetical protein